MPAGTPRTLFSAVEVDEDAMIKRPMSRTTLLTRPCAFAVDSAPATLPGALCGKTTCPTEGGQNF